MFYSLVNPASRGSKYRCLVEGCGASFYETGTLLSHRRQYHAHGRERPHQCNEPGCGASFTGSSGLTVHTRLHTGERPYACTLCNAAFPASGVLKSHVRNNHAADGKQVCKAKEQMLAEFLAQTAYPFLREHRVSLKLLIAGGTFFRIDFVLTLRGSDGSEFLVLLENDEFAHADRTVDAEISRMVNAHKAIQLRGKGLPLVWVRFNCDAFSVDGRRALASRQDRYAALVALLQQLQASSQPLPEMSVHYMYYDVLTQADASLRLSLFAHRDYPDEFKALVAGVHAPGVLAVSPVASPSSAVAYPGRAIRCRNDSQRRRRSPEYDGRAVGAAAEHGGENFCRAFGNCCPYA